MTQAPGGVPVGAGGGKTAVYASGAQEVHSPMVLEPLSGALRGQSCLVPGRGYPDRKEEESPCYFIPLTICYPKDSLFSATIIQTGHSLPLRNISVLLIRFFSFLLLFYKLQALFANELLMIPNTSKR